MLNLLEWDFLNVMSRGIRGHIQLRPENHTVIKIHFKIRLRKQKMYFPEVAFDYFLVNCKMKKAFLKRLFFQITTYINYYMR